MPEKISPNYFDLPEPKPPLPVSSQQLPHSLRHLFPCSPNNKLDIKHFTDLLHPYFGFKRLPNNYIAYKPHLSNDPATIQTKISYTYPINNKEITNNNNVIYKFIKEVSDSL